MVPEDYMGDVIGDLNSRRGADSGHGGPHGRPGDQRHIVPLSEMFGYATDLRSKTQGRGQSTAWSPATTPKCPKSVSEAIIGSRQKA